MNPGPIEQGGKLASSLIEALKGQPLALALIVVNMLFLGGGMYVLHDMAQAMRIRDERRDGMFAQMLSRECPTPKQDETQWPPSIRG